MSVVDYQTPYPGESLRQAYMRRWGELDNEYQSGWRGVQEEAIRFVAPYRGRFNSHEQNKGPRKDQAIFNDTATDSWKKLEAAMFTGITNPTRKWKQFRPSDPTQPDDDTEIRQHLELTDDVVDRMIARYFYGPIREMFGDIIDPATGVLFMEPDEKQKVIRYFHFPCGSYRLSFDADGNPDTLMRVFAMNTGQLVRKFGYDNCSIWVRQEYDQKRYQIWHQVLHVVERRYDRDAKKIDALNKPWRSCWYEWGDPQRVANLDDKPLRESGYDKRPFVVGRWAVLGEDAYGSDSPAIQSLGDNKELQGIETATGVGIAQEFDPALNVPADLENASSLPGRRNPLPNNTQVQIQRTVASNPDGIRVAGEEKRIKESRIKRAFFADYLTMFTQDERTQPETAEYVRAQKEERLLMLGGVVLRFTSEVLDPVCDFALYYAQLWNLIPPPPSGLSKLRVEYLNNFSIAQKALGIASADQWVSTLVALATNTQRPEVLDKVDFDEYADQGAALRGVNPKLVRSDDAVAQLRAQRAKAQAQAQQAAAQAQGAKSIKDLSQADPENLDQLMQRLGPAASALSGGGAEGSA